MRNLLRSSALLPLLLLAVPMRSQTPSTAPAKADAAAAAPHSGWNFDLVPKAFQKNPSLDLTIMSELTDAGKKLPTASSEKPVYYTTISNKYLAKGDLSHNHPPSPTEIEGLLRHSLSSSGFFPFDATHAPTIGLVYLWGPDEIVDNDVAVGSVNRRIRNIIDRAALVGGDKFAADLAQAFKESSEIAAASSRPLGSGSEGTGDMGAAAAMAIASALSDPVHLFMFRRPENEFLMNQAASDCYYVVVSAYDYSSLATPQKQLLWRTRLTVSAQGVSQKQTFPALISAAAPYFGKDMSTPQIVTKLAREGSVEVGAPVIVDASAAKSPGKK